MGELLVASLCVVVFLSNKSILLCFLRNMVAALPAIKIRAALTAYFTLHSYRQAAAQAGVSKRTIHTWVTRLGERQTGKRQRRRRGTTVLDKVAPALAAILAMTPVCGNVPRLRHQLGLEGLTASLSSTWRALGRLSYTWKKLRLRSVPDLSLFHGRRTAFAALLAGIDPADVLSVDEASFDSNMAPMHGYSPKGLPFHVPVQRRTRTRVSLTMAVSHSRMEHWTIVPGSSNGLLFQTFLRGLEHMPQRYVLMDNVSFHKSNAVLALLKNMGKVPLFILSYSPEFNPIENMFSYVKGDYRPLCFQSDGVPHQTVLQACLAASQPHSFVRCQGAFRASWAFNP